MADRVRTMSLNEPKLADPTVVPSGYYRQKPISSGSEGLRDQTTHTYDGKDGHPTLFVTGTDSSTGGSSGATSSQDSTPIRKPEYKVYI